MAAEQTGPKRWTVDGIVFYPNHAQGAWYQVGTLGEVGALYMPMLLDGSPDVTQVGEVEIEYKDAR